MTEEKIRGIIKEPDETCPLINKIQGALDDVCEYFEELRKANANIRNWGEDWKVYAISAENYHTKEIESLTDELSGVQFEIKEAEEKLKELEDYITVLENKLETGNE